MKRSNAVILVLSGALAVGCDRKAPTDTSWGSGESSGQVVTNNTYVAGRGYYHAPFHGFFPYPYNAVVPGSGYYHGGQISPTKHESAITASRPPGTPSPHVNRGGFTSGRSGSIGSASS